MQASKRFVSIAFAAFLVLLLVLVVAAATTKGERGASAAVMEQTGWYNTTLPSGLAASQGAEIYIPFFIENNTNESTIVNEIYLQVFNSTDAEIYNSTIQYAWQTYEFSENYTLTGNESYFTLTINASLAAQPGVYRYYATSQHNISFFQPPIVYHSSPALENDFGALEAHINGSYDAAYEAVFGLAAYNPNNTAIPVRWYINDTLNASGVFNQTTDFRASFEYPDVTYRVKVEADDSRSFTRTWNVTVPYFNVKPRISSFEPGLYTVFIPAGQNMTFSVNATDLNGDTLAYYWELNGNNVTTGAHSNSYDLRANASLAQTNTLRVRVNDTKSESIQTWTIYTNDNASYKFLIAQSKSTVTKGETVEFALNSTELGLSGRVTFAILNGTTGAAVKTASAAIGPGGIAAYVWDTIDAAPGAYLVNVSYNSTLYRTASVTVVSGPAANVVIDRITIPTNNVEGEPVIINLTLRNRGDAAADVNVSLEINGAVTTVVTNIWLNASASAPVSFSWTAAGNNFTFGINVTGEDANIVKRYTPALANDTISIREERIVKGENVSLIVPYQLPIAPRPLNHPPVIGWIPSIFVINTTTEFRLQIAALDQDADVLAYSLNTTLLSVDSAGYIHGFISAPGTYDVRLAVNDTKNETYAHFTIVVEQSIQPVMPAPSGAGWSVSLGLLLIGVVAVCLVSTTAFVVLTEVGICWLLWLLWPLFSLIKKETLFDNFTRGEVYGAVRTQPGIHFNALRGKLEIANGTLYHHLSILEREGFIRTEVRGFKRLIYPIKLPLKDEMKISVKFPMGEEIEPGVELTRFQQMIIQAVAKHPGITQDQIVRKTKLTRAVVSYNLKKFAEKGMIVKKKPEGFMRESGYYVP